MHADGGYMTAMEHRPTGQDMQTAHRSFRADCRVLAHPAGLASEHRAVVASSALQYGMPNLRPRMGRDCSAQSPAEQTANGTSRWGATPATEDHVWLLNMKPQVGPPSEGNDGLWTTMTERPYADGAFGTKYPKRFRALSMHSTKPCRSLGMHGARTVRVSLKLRRVRSDVPMRRYACPRSLFRSYLPACCPALRSRRPSVFVNAWPQRVEFSALRRLREASDGATRDGHVGTRPISLVDGFHGGWNQASQPRGSDKVGHSQPQRFYIHSLLSWFPRRELDHFVLGGTRS